MRLGDAGFADLPWGGFDSAPALSHFLIHSLPGFISGQTRGWVRARLLVRRKSIRGVLLAGMGALLLHPNTGQLLWTLLLGSTFIAFIPIEEARMIAARGDDYRRCMQRTPTACSAVSGRDRIASPGGPDVRPAGGDAVGSEQAEAARKL